jgi:hypothetical protein
MPSVGSAGTPGDISISKKSRDPSASGHVLTYLRSPRIMPIKPADCRRGHQLRLQPKQSYASATHPDGVIDARSNSFTKYNRLGQPSSLGLGGDVGTCTNLRTWRVGRMRAEDGAHASGGAERQNACVQLVGLRSFAVSLAGSIADCVLSSCRSSKRSLIKLDAHSTLQPYEDR